MTEPVAASPAAVSVTRDTTRGPAPVGFTRTDLMLSLMVLIWGVNYIVIKAALREISPIAFNAVRFTFAGSCVLAIAWATGARRPDRADVPRILLLALLGNTIYQFGFIKGVSLTRAGNAALLFGAVPVQTAVLSHLAGHEKLRWRDAFGLMTSAAGIATIVLGSSEEVRFTDGITGDLLILGATVCWSVYIIGVKPLADKYGAIPSTAWTMSIGALGIVLYSIPALVAQPWRSVSAGAWSGLFLSGFGALVVAYLIWFRGVRVLGPARTAFYSNITPVVTMAAAWPFLGEQPTAWQLLGAAGIFTGLWLTRT